MHFEFTYFYFVLIHLQLKRQLRSCIRSRSFLENQTQFQTKMGKVYTRFQTKKAQKPYSLWQHIPINGLYNGVRPWVLTKYLVREQVVRHLSYEFNIIYTVNFFIVLPV